MATILQAKRYATTAAQQTALVLAQEQITSLRRLYALATDALGKTADASSAQYGLEVYHQIFTPDADIQVSGATLKALRGTGPDAWADVVRNALHPYLATQHLIGSQVVDFTQLEWDTLQVDPANFRSGRARMESYVQAWHAWPDKRLRLVLGTYHDEVIFHPEHGWRICAMNLEHISGEERTLGD
jgi:hypothetical protein